MSENRSRTDLLAHLRRAGREHDDATVQFHAALAGELDLNPTDYKALGILERLGPMSAGDLGRHTGLAAASMTNLMDRLAAKGLLRREPDPSDRRRVLLRADVSALSENDVFASWQRSSWHQWQRYSDGELAVILSFLADTAARLRSRTDAIASMTAPAARKRGRRRAD